MLLILSIFTLLDSEMKYQSFILLELLCVVDEDESPLVHFQRR